MKKTILLTTLASVVLTGCVKDESVELSTQLPKEISFGSPMMYNQTKSVDGEITGTLYPEGENFVVFAVETNGDFRGWEATNVVTQENDENTFFPEEGVVVEKGANDNYWHITGTTKYFWPDEPNHRLTFAAYSPARANQDGTIIYNDNGLSIQGFKIQDLASSQYDLLFSPRTVNATTSPVAINFKHALSSIRFRFVKPADGAASIVINRVEIFGNIYNKGDFFQDIASNSATSTGSPRWDNKSIEGTVTYTLFNGQFEVPASTGSEIGGIQSFLPIPQNLTSDAKVRIVYKSKQQEDDAYSNEIIEEIPFIHFLTTGTSYTSEWQMGKRYSYHIHFGALKEIYFAPSVTDWDPVDEAGVYTIQ
ncbi:MAG: fimbrillin family protein [Parabacteroides sp.]|nr:fimbrillin family protein [Parabacteroides sp.]